MDGARCERAEGGLSVVSKARWNSTLAQRARKDGARGFASFTQEDNLRTQGSFDCVSAAPRFAQDDSLRKISASWDRVRDGWREMRTSAGRLVPGVEGSVESHPCAKSAQGWGTGRPTSGAGSPFREEPTVAAAPFAVFEGCEPRTSIP